MHENNQECEEIRLIYIYIQECEEIRLIYIFIYILFDLVIIDQK